MPDSTVSLTLKKFVPAPFWKRMRSMRYTLQPGHLPDDERAARIAELAGPIIRRDHGWQKLFYRLEALNLHALPVHYYTPIPDTRELARTRERWDKESDFSHVRYDRQAEAKLNEELARFQSEFAAMPSALTLQAQKLGPGYGEIEALLLHAMLRHFKPRRLIEVGSGVSTYYATHALAMNRAEGSPGEMTCIEPYPAEHLRNAEFTPNIIDKQVQDVDLSYFQQLEAGDVFFIDSSHAVKIGSDVNYLLLDVVPSLKPGVLIHIHDIPFPRVASRNHWTFEKAMFWQEAALLKALLTDSSTLEMIYCSSFLFYKNPEMLKQTFPSFDPATHFPSSLWLRKIA